MIWLRRSLAILLVIPFILSFILMLLILRVNSTFGNPDFYVDRLREADIYNFIYDQALPTVLEGIEIDSQFEGLPLDTARAKAELVPLAREVLPPDWIQARVEDGITQILPYALGDTEEFSVSVPLKERVVAAGRAAKQTLHKEDIIPALYQEAVARAADQAASSLGGLPDGLRVSKEELRSAIETIVPPEWLLAQADQAIDQVVPYLTQDAEHFTIRLVLRDRVDAAAAVAVDFLGRPETYDYIFEQTIVPLIEENLGARVELSLGPGGVTVISSEEVVATVREVLPPAWFQERLEDTIYQLASYLKGESEALDLVLPLEDRKEAAAQALERLIDRKLGALSPLIPGPVKREAIDSLILSNIPNQWAYTEADLRQALGKNWEALDKAREWVSLGWSYTEADLRQSLGAQNAARLDEIRDRISQGYTFTEAELRSLLIEAEGGEEALASLDEARHWLGLARQWLFLGWAVPALLLGLIGPLGGRNPGSKIAWAAVVLALAAAIVFAAAGPAYSSLVRPELDAALRQQAVPPEAAWAVFVDKGISLIEGTADAFVTGLRNWALVSLAIAGAGLALAIAWPVYIGRHEPLPGHGQE